MARCCTASQDMAADLRKKLTVRARIALRLYRATMSSASALAELTSPMLKHCSRRVKDGLPHYQGQLPLPLKKPVLWVHGVSMGESMVAVGFATELRRRFPDYEIVFSTTHPDVKATVVKKDFAAAVAYFPLDNRRAISEALSRWNPAAVFVAETDFWPEFSFQCREQNIPLILINGRISSKICSFYKRFQGLAELVFQSFTLFSVQSSVDAERLLELGVDSSKIRITGNMKADLTVAASDVDLSSISAWVASRRLMIFGSLHPDEFAMLTPYLQALLEKIPALIIAPRNPENAEIWKKLLLQKSFSAELRSKVGTDSVSSILLLDSMGELAALYRLADIAFVGGSLNDKVGGHNPLEIVQQRVPLLMGPGFRNFNDIVEQLKGNAAIRIVASGEELVQCACEVVENAAVAENMVNHAQKVLENNSGAINRTIDLVSPWLKLAV